jgi:Leucine-rich repeat (LRR) protein
MRIRASTTNHRPKDEWLTIKSLATSRSTTSSWKSDECTCRPGIADLCELERLDVSNNDLKQIPPELGRVKTIKSIVLDGNPIKSIRRDIIGRGTMAIMKHLRNRLGEPEEGEVGTNLNPPFLFFSHFQNVC